MKNNNTKLSFLIPLITIVFLFTISLSASAALTLDEVSYKLSGDGSKVNSLHFNMNYDLDNINEFDAHFTYYNEDIKLEGSWLINFLQTPLNEAYLELLFVNELSDLSPKPAIGLSGTSNYQNYNDLYWETKYFINDSREKPLVYEGGIVFPITNNGKLSLGIGNSYWYLNNPNLKLGFFVDF
ncbi:MAG: hypothetical protein ACQEQF_09780 [Bacillota bacterium]